MYIVCVLIGLERGIYNIMVGVKKVVKCSMALNCKTNKIVYASEADKNCDDYRCLVCEEKLTLVNGRANARPYFRHSSNESCNNSDLEGIAIRLMKDALFESMVLTVPNKIFFNGFADDEVIVKKAHTDKIMSIVPEKDNNKWLCEDLIVGTEYESIRVNFTRRNWLNNRRDAADKPKMRGMTRLGLPAFYIAGMLREYVAEKKEITLPELISEVKDILATDDIFLQSISFLEDDELYDIQERYHKSVFQSNATTNLCPLTDYKVPVTREYCKTCPCYLHTLGRGSEEDKAQMCLGKGCYTSIEQMLLDISLEDRKDLICLPTEKPKFRLVNKLCPKCGKPMRLGVGLRGKTFDGLLVRVPRETNNLYYVCTNDFCTKTADHPLSCPNKEVLVKAGGKSSLRKCKGDAIPLIKTGKGTNGVAGHGKGACYIGCSNSEKDLNNLPAYEKPCNSSVTIFDSEEDMHNRNFSEEIIAIGGIDMYFANNKRAMKIINKVRSKKQN